MAETVPDALRDRLGYRTVLAWLALVAVFVYVLDSSVEQVAMAIVTTALLGGASLLNEVYDVREVVSSLALGLVALVGGVGLLAFEDGSRYFAGVLVAIGAWLVVDAAQLFRHEGLYSDEAPDGSGDDRDGHEVYASYVTGRVDELLRERPRTRLELADELAADDETIDRALETLADRGLLVREGSQLRVLPERPDGLGRVREVLGKTARRLARPVRLELQPRDS